VPVDPPSPTPPSRDGLAGYGGQGPSENPPPQSTTAWIRDRFKANVLKHGHQAPPAEPVPERIGRYKVIERIGRGAIANVYRASDEAGRDVAIKVIRSDQAGADAEAVFRREANILQKLRHPDIILLHVIDRDGDGLYLVMDYVPGPTMQYVIDQGAPRAELVALLTRVARAVDHAHRHGIVHRDLKPQNILVGPDGPVVTDFGIARAMDAVTRVKGALPVGTPTHMAPEQVDRRLAAIGPATDVWGLGVVLYTVLTRRLPFIDTDTPALYARILNDAPRPPRMLDGEVPEPFESVCLRALEKRADDRHASASEFADELERASAGGPLQRPPLKRLGRWIRRLFK